MSDIKNVMLISPDEVKAYGDINLNVDDSVMGASIRASQIYLRDVIGTPLMERLQTLVYNAIQGNDDNIEEPQNALYKELLDDYVQTALAYKVSSEICDRISLKIRNIGVSQDNDTNINSASLRQINRIKNVNETYWCDSLNRMFEWLKVHKEHFPELEGCGCGDRKPNLNNKFGNTGIWLG